MVRALISKYTSRPPDLLGSSLRENSTDIRLLDMLSGDTWTDLLHHWAEFHHRMDLQMTDIHLQQELEIFFFFVRDVWIVLLQHKNLNQQQNLSFK